MFEFLFGYRRGKRYFIKMVARESGERFVSGTFKSVKAAQNFADNLDNDLWTWELVG